MMEAAEVHEVHPSPRASIAPRYLAFKTWVTIANMYKEEISASPLHSGKKCELSRGGE